MSLERLVEGLTKANVSFVIVGMVAGQLYGSRLTTYDLDVVYERSSENIDRLARYLSSIDAYVKETWPNEGVASDFSKEVLLREHSLTLGTKEGEIDLLHRVDAIGEYPDVLARSRELVLRTGRKTAVILLPALIESKRASNREKDRLHIPELEALDEIRSRSRERE